ncbi:MAG TPA: ribosome biogenesis factor YjgA [Rhodocyclaceae bacterium]|nr:ribosome biogenesis factor YjgA [Rhodocyclaceae bacterium]
MPHWNEEERQYDGPSKSQKKRDSHALQDLGAALAELSLERLAKIEMPEPLHEAVRALHSIRSHEARRRQVQYIGKLMRDVDPVPIRAALDALNGVSRQATARLHRLEQLRDRLLADEAVLTEIGDMYPAADIQRLRQLRRNAVKEHEQSKPPRSFRELFKLLREIDEESQHSAREMNSINDDMLEDGNA